MSLLRVNKKLSIIAVAMLIFNISLFAAESINSCNKRVFNIKVNDAVSLSEMLSQLSDMCHFSVATMDVEAAKFMAQNMQGINIKNLTLREVFNIILLDKGLNYSYKNNILKISAIQTRSFMVDYISSIREGTAITKASVDASPSRVNGENEGSSLDTTSDNKITSTEKFDFWAKINEEIKNIMNNGIEKFVAPAPIINQNAGLITVTGTKTQLDRVANYVNNLQKRLKKQVMLDVSIISVNLDNAYTTGIDWSKFQLGFNTYLDGNPATPSNYTVGNRYGAYSNTSLSGVKGFWAIAANLNFNIDGMINFLETKGKTKVISSPKVMTLNNQQALITVGDTVNYTIPEETNFDNSLSGKTTTTLKQYSIFIGILLNILPEVSDNNKVMLRINPSLSTFKYADDNKKQTEPRKIAPDTIQKKLSTVVEVNSGDTVILGGLIGQTKSKDNTSVPILSEIPLIGNLFKSSADRLSTTELVFVVTPRVIEVGGSSPIRDSLKELGYSKSLYDNQ